MAEHSTFNVQCLTLLNRSHSFPPFFCHCSTLWSLVLLNRGSTLWCLQECHHQKPNWVATGTLWGHHIKGIETVFWSREMSSDAIFACIFRPFSTQLHFTFLTPPFSFMLTFVMFVFLCLSRLRTGGKNTIRLVLPDTEQLVYWTTNIPKQSCCGSSSPGSCTGTSSAATKCSHHSKFRTSWTRSMSRSASIARMLLVIDRFLATTTARSPQPTATIRWAASSDLARDALLPTGTGKVVAPSTRFTVTSSYRVFVRMIHLPDKMFWQNAALAGTHGKKNDSWEDRSRNWKRRGILDWRKIVHQKILFGLFQERLDTSFQLLCMKSRVVLRIGIPQSWWTARSRRRRRTTPSAWQSRVQPSQRSIRHILKTLLLLSPLLLRLLNHLLLPRRVVWSWRQQMISATTNWLLQNGNWGGQLQNGLLQPSYSTLAGLESTLLETRQGLEVHDPILQKTDVFRTTVDTVVHHLPLLPEDHVVLLDGVFDGVGRHQDLLTMLLGVSLDTTNLCRMGSPLHLSIIHL